MAPPAPANCFDKWITQPTRLLQTFGNKTFASMGNRPVLQATTASSAENLATFSAAERTAWGQLTVGRALISEGKVTPVTRTSVSGAANVIMGYLSRASKAEQEERDVAMWYGFLRFGGTGMMTAQNFFTAIRKYGLIYRNWDGDWADYATTGLCLASAMSHGNRIMFLLPPSSDASLQGIVSDGDDDRMYNAITNGAGMPSRGFATHGVTRVSGSSAKALLRGRKQWFTEDKGKGTALAEAIAGRQRGLNLALGGVGNINSYSGITIAQDGAHGHMYANYVAPKWGKPGCLLVGVENSAGGATGQSGKSHDAGGHAGEYSATGGKKWKDFDHRFITKPKGLDVTTLVCDMSNDTTVDAVAKLSGWNDSFLSDITPAVDPWRAPLVLRGLGNGIGLPPGFAGPGAG